MNKRGFTLIELLGAMTILALIALLAVPGIIRLINNNRDRMYTTQIETLKNALKTWGDANATTLPTTQAVIDSNGVCTSGCLVLTLGELKSYGLIDFDFINPKTSECVNDALQLRIARRGNGYDYAVGRNFVNNLNPPNGAPVLAPDFCENQEELPIITLNGDSIIYLYQNMNFVDPGATARTIGGNSVSATRSSFRNQAGATVGLNSLPVGVYVVEYTATHNGRTAHAFRRVVVRIQN